MAKKLIALDATFVLGAEEYRALCDQLSDIAETEGYTLDLKPRTPTASEVKEAREFMID